ncbi:MAG: endopeptidase La [Spirochaetes bacterium]|nr:endopeptidase La [Spirochaetota bacterium]
MKIQLRRHELFMVPLKDLVVFPHMVVPFFVGRRRSVRSVEAAMTQGRLLFLVPQKKGGVEEPGEADFHPVGTVARILQLSKLPDGKLRLLVEGEERAAVVRFTDTTDAFRVQVRPLKAAREVTPQLAALSRSVRRAFTQYQEVSRKVPPEVLAAVEAADDPDRLADLVAGGLPLSAEHKLELLSLEDTAGRLERLVAFLSAETELAGLEQEIASRVKRRVEKSQKDWFLTEQMKEIQRELGAESDDPTGAKELEEKMKACGLSAEALEKCQRELKRLARMQPMSPESAVLRTYLEWVTDLPWRETTADNRDIERARVILDEDHYDLKKVKERILDFIAVRQLKGRVKGPILCFIGPPGTGKTSLGRSVARALGRTFVRMSLGGVRDEAEIRGHRKTYVGALPGKVLQAMRKAGTRNPVFLLDEIDKMSSDWRGDPASALLEVLDPEQNATFLDHYLEVPYDLSDVMFITTANSAHNIPFPLRDRMEVIEISGYTDLEKLEIADRFLVPKQLGENGLAWADIRFQRSAILKLIRSYTLEAGVRNLEREIANVLRKIARDAVKRGLMPPLPEPEPAAAVETAPEAPAEPAAAPDEAAVATADGAPAPAAPEAPAAPAVDAPAPAAAAPAPAEAAAAPAPALELRVTVTGRSVASYLGKVKFIESSFAREVKPGLAYGLAWTELGGQLLPVEVAILVGKGELLLTGSLGDVMKESAQAALSFLRARHAELGIPADFAKDRDIHVHVPEGAIPKDGPSAGITLVAAMLSAVRGVASASGFAMTGEITLTGRLLPIGGVKEKVLAAHRYKMTRVLLPRQNEKDLEDIPEEVREALSFVFADSVTDALAILFPPADRAGEPAAADGLSSDARPTAGIGETRVPGEPAVPVDPAAFIEPSVPVEPVQDAPPPS